MANLVIGDGQTRSAQHDADIFKAIFGDGTLITKGEMRATKPNNNTIRIGSGMAVCEGRFFENEIYDEFSIPAGEDGEQATYFLGYRIYRESAGDRIEKYISKIKHAQGSLSAGDNEMYAILYQVTMNGINLGDPVLLCDEIPDIVKKMLEPEAPAGVNWTVAEVTDKQVDSQQKLNVYLSKEGNLVICDFGNVLNVRAANKSITLSGSIPKEYRPKRQVAVACTTVVGETATGHIRLLIKPDGKIQYNSSVKGWQEIFGNACWYAEE